MADILKPGTEMIAAGYCMYGSAIDVVLTFNKVMGESFGLPWP